MSKSTIEFQNKIKVLESQLSFSVEKESLLKDEIKILQEALSTEKEIKLNLHNKNCELSEISRIDGLTSLYNHQYMMVRCEYEFNRNLRYGTPLTCIIIDIDHFKHVNDNYGHQFGDFVLEELALLLKKFSRSVDICCRYGGEEFLIMVSRSEEKAFEYISRFHQMIESHKFISNDITVKLTFSAGIAEQKKEIKSYQDLIKRADQALYQAKQDGRNLIRVWAKHTKQGSTLDTKGIKNLKEQFDTLNKQVKETYLQSTNALLKAIDARDHYTLIHSQQVSQHAVQIAKKLELPDETVVVIKNAGLLHDIGKIGIEEKILVKNKALTDEEYQLLKRHSVIGVNILKDISFLEQELPFILHHHERFDGSGYPHGLKSRSIPLGAKILAVADAYVAMTTDREFKNKKTTQEAIGELTDGKEKQFDPEIVDIFIEILESNSNTC